MIFWTWKDNIINATYTSFHSSFPFIIQFEYNRGRVNIFKKTIKRKRFCVCLFNKNNNKMVSHFRTLPHMTSIKKNLFESIVNIYLGCNIIFQICTHSHNNILTHNKYLHNYTFFENCLIKTLKILSIVTWNDSQNTFLGNLESFLPHRRAYVHSF